MTRTTYNLARMNMIMHDVHYRKFDIRQKDTNVLFIDASNNFEKAKNQNHLREQDIDKIISTYRERKAEENDYNLNIPRYVDTFEEEEPVDLDEVKLLKL